MKFNKLIPELSVSNINKSKEFYLSIGFKIVYERKENKFAFIELEGNQLMIEENNGNWSVGTLDYPYGRGINISMEVSNVKELYDKIKKLNINIFKEFMINEYKVNNEVFYDEEFLIQDPDGYLLRFNN